MEDVGFVVVSSAGPQALRAAGARAALAVSAGPERVVESSANAGSVRYDVVGAGGVLLLVLRVSWHELGSGTRRVTLSVHGQREQRRRVFGRVVGRARVPGRQAAAAFTRELRAQLS
ncbi:hypothetical protein [Modestobacter sp. Leaf380]|uniref:hypothetical protein n=1 Tax=Modestobacter sp. Leaf380 TaxID=1736356 RepID=UPI0006F9D319|nr:hypothetical protein [Modestobacter sp. Leaf380]KQS68851.1 hypothetical protein ASG41_08060 [Modestobacter sp. Leaf380]